MYGNLKFWIPKWKREGECPLTLLEFLDFEPKFKYYLISHITRNDGRENEDCAIQGLFISIVPSLFLSQNEGGYMLIEEEDDGFEVESRLTNQFEQVFVRRDSLIFMLGDGIRSWLHDKSTLPTRPCLHRVRMKNRNRKIVRAWFGRMFFPPKDAYIPKLQTTYDKVRFETITSNNSILSSNFVGCSSSKTRFLLADLTDSACGVNEIYCWMACRSIKGLVCHQDESIQCLNSKTKEIWDNTTHCLDCKPECYGGENSSKDDDIDNHTICNTKLYPTNMYMDGFNGLSSHIPCLVFLFQSWVLDTPFKFILASISTFAFGIIIELIIFIRREIKCPSSTPILIHNCTRNVSGKTQSIALIALYGVQLVFSYLLMLLAMSYSSYIFVMCMLGLIVGHYFFNFHLPARRNEACCAVTNHYEETTNNIEDGFPVHVNSRDDLEETLLPNDHDHLDYSCCNTNNHRNENTL